VGGSSGVSDPVTPGVHRHAFLIRHVFAWLLVAAGSRAFNRYGLRRVDELLIAWLQARGIGE
jgi:hypothetical protein